MNLIKDRRGQAQLWGLAALVAVLILGYVGMRLLNKGKLPLEKAREAGYKDINTNLPCKPEPLNVETCKPADQLPNVAEQAPETQLSPEEKQKLEHRRYCLDTKPANSESLNSLQLICADLCEEENFKSAHSGICKSAVKEQPSTEQPSAEFE